MPFINKKGASSMLNSIQKGKCTGRCRSVWMRNIQYALKTKTNPLKLTSNEKKTMKSKIVAIKSGKQEKETSNKYKNRPSPPYPANNNCNKKMKGNDGNMYISKPNYKGICKWIKI